MKTLKPNEIAAYCDVHQRTVSRWIANGQLKGHKLPGRGNYRVLLEDFLNFLQRQQMPLPGELLTNTASQDRQESGIKRVLIIDDEAAIRQAIRRVLLPTRYDIIAAEDGFQAGVKMIAERPDLVILDLSMPGLDGFDVIRFVRQRPELKDLKILVLSGLAPSELDEAVRLGANEAISKPFDNADLLARTRALLE